MTVTPDTLTPPLRRGRGRTDPLLGAPRPRAESIIDAVCNHFGVHLRDVCSSCRMSDVVRARAAVSRLLHEHCQFSYPEIAAHLGRGYHTTYSYGAVRYETIVDESDRELLTDIVRGLIDARLRGWRMRTIEAMKEHEKKLKTIRKAA